MEWGCGVWRETTVSLAGMVFVRLTGARRFSCLVVRIGQPGHARSARSPPGDILDSAGSACTTGRLPRRPDQQARKIGLCGVLGTRMYAPTRVGIRVTTPLEPSPAQPISSLHTVFAARGTFFYPWSLISTFSSLWRYFSLLLQKPSCTNVGVV